MFKGESTNTLPLVSRGKVQSPKANILVEHKNGGQEGRNPCDNHRRIVFSNSGIVHLCAFGGDIH